MELLRSFESVHRCASLYHSPSESSIDAILSENLAVFGTGVLWKTVKLLDVDVALRL
jgi:hypothetical protein